MKEIQLVKYKSVDIAKLSTKRSMLPKPLINQCTCPIAAWLFVISFVSYLLVGFICAFFPPLPARVAAGMAIPTDSTCMHVTRHADYITAEIGIGTPVQHMSLLVRMDSILDHTSTDTSMLLFSKKTVESTTVDCTLEGRCEDIVVVQENGPYGVLARKIAKFDYKQASLEYTTASRILGVDGELRMRVGMHYWITSTHMCYSESEASLTAVDDEAVSAIVKGTFLYANRSSLLSSSETMLAPAATLQNVCMGENHTEQLVKLFPVDACLEASWLSIIDTNLYNNEPGIVEVRRSVTELGVSCAQNSTSIPRDLVLYRLDCEPFQNCADTPSMPFRRIATSSIALQIQTNGKVAIWFKYDHTLSTLPRLANSSHAFLLSLLKLLMILIAAAVVFIRAKKSTASSSWLFKHCIEVACERKNGHKFHDSSLSTSEDILIGALAFGCRGLMVFYRRPYLSMDGQVRVCNSETIATTLSIIHWVLRYFCIERGGQSPISMLGGSTAIIDSTSSVMMAFAEAPTLSISTGKFDPTARLLTSILISLIVIARCAFSASCCGLLLENETNRLYRLVVLYAACTWCLQSAALAILISDLFVLPSSASMSRHTTGDVLPARILLFIALVCAGLPRLSMTLRHITSERDHHID